MPQTQTKLVDKLLEKPELLADSAVGTASRFGCSEAEAERAMMAARAQHRAERQRAADEVAIASVTTRLRVALQRAAEARTVAESEQDPVCAAKARFQAAEADQRGAVLEARLTAMLGGNQRRLRAHLADVETR